MGGVYEADCDVALTNEQREYWTSLFVEELNAEFDKSDVREVHRRVLRAHSKDQDRGSRAAVGRLRQEVRVRFFQEKGYVERPDSRGTMRFVDPATASWGPHAERRAPNQANPQTWRWRVAVAGSFGLLVVFGLVIAC